MNWSNVKLILQREVRDQLRDRRTLFLIAVLPLLLYPLLGMSFFQVTQFMREHAIRVLVIGAPVSTELPPLVEQDRFAARLFSDPITSQNVQVTLQPSKPADGTRQDPLEQARHDMQQGNYEVVVFFPANFAAQFARFHHSLLEDKSG